MRRFVIATLLALASAAGLAAAEPARQNQPSNPVLFCIVTCGTMSGCEKAQCLRTCITGLPPKTLCPAR